jgi:biotin transport system substrate-specific component
LADRLWPDRADRVPSALRLGLLVLAGTALLTLSAKINVPLPYVPMTMQTLVVLMIGAAYGARLGLATVLAYLAEGALGLPVFAGPVGGIAYMMGGTGGYLAGFAVAAFVAGWMCERGPNSVLRMFVVMAAGHVIIVAFGFAWLAFGLHLGAHKAWLVGVVPFIAGSVIKSLLGALLMSALWSAADRTASR